MYLPPSQSSETAFDTQRTRVLPVVTILAIIACVAVYLGLLAADDYESWETLARFGYLPAESIWSGSCWSLFSSVFVHFDLWHLGFNAYWLWFLGKRMEQALGSLRFLAFFIGAAWVSSACQLAFSDTTGIGASGVVYAMFGFMWLSRHRVPAFSEVVVNRTIQIFILWLITCIIITQLKILEVGNAAHVSGLVFGGVVAGAFVLPKAPRMMKAILLTLLILSALPPFWAPWSVPWLSHHAYEKHTGGDLERALDLYTRVIDAEPRNAWAYLNRSMVYDELGFPGPAQADFDTARGIDPAITGAE